MDWIKNVQKKHFQANLFACFPFGIHNWAHAFRWAVSIHVLELLPVQLHSICCFTDISIMRRCTHSCNLSLLVPSSVLLLSIQVIFCHCETYWGLWGQIKTHQILLLVLFKQVNGIMPVSLLKQIKACIVSDLSIKNKKRVPGPQCWQIDQFIQVTGAHQHNWQQQNPCFFCCSLILCSADFPARLCNHWSVMHWLASCCLLCCYFCA